MKPKDSYCVLDVSYQAGDRDIEPSSHILTFSAKILAGTEMNKTVGILTGAILDLFTAENFNISPDIVFDCFSSELAHFSPLVNRYGFVRSIAAIAPYSICAVMVIERIQLQESWRHIGIGRNALEIAIETIGRGCNLVALNAFPLQWEGRVSKGKKAFRQDRDNLIAYYESCGFTKTRFGTIMVRGT